MSSTTVTMYYADWCGNCTRIKPTFEVASRVAPSQFSMVSDVQIHQGVAPHVEITGFPTFVFRQNGRVVKKIVGADAGALMTSVREYFGGGAMPPRPIRKIGGAPEVDHDAFRNIMLR